MKSAVRDRIKVTKTGKVKRRKMGSSHFRSKKSAGAKQSRRSTHDLGYPQKALIKKMTGGK